MNENEHVRHRTTQDSEPSTAELVQQASEQVSRLVRDELRLAQVEMKEKAKHAGFGIGMFGAGGLLALFGVGTLIIAIVMALALVMPVWLSALVVAIVLLAAAGVCALLGRGQVKQATPFVPKQATESVREDVEMLKERSER